MKLKKVLLATLLAASGFAVQSAFAASNWVGIADYSAAPGAAAGDVATGSFDTYDFVPGVVLLKDTTATTGLDTYDGFYQSYVGAHLLNSLGVSESGLNSNYEVTVTAWFKETANGNIFTIDDGGVELRFDSNVNRDFNADFGFSDGAVILSGNIISGSGGLFNVGSSSVGVTDLMIEVTGYDQNVFSPDTIATGSSIFTLRLNNPADASFLGPINSVMGNTYESGDIKMAADGYLVLQVPEAETYAMMLAGLGLVGFMARRRNRASV